MQMVLERAMSNAQNIKSDNSPQDTPKISPSDTPNDSRRPTVVMFYNNKMRASYRYSAISFASGQELELPKTDGDWTKRGFRPSWAAPYQNRTSNSDAPKIIITEPEVEKTHTDETIALAKYYLSTCN